VLVAEISSATIQRTQQNQRVTKPFYDDVAELKYT